MRSRPIILAAFGLLACLAVANRAQAQATAAVPRPDYFLSFGLFFDGDYRRAGEAFRSAASGGVRSTEGRWVDSICYHTMMGECYLQLGELRLALEQYEAAVTLLLAHQNWMLRIEFPPTVQTSQRTIVRPATWGQPQRPAVMGDIPQKILSMQGRPDNQTVLQQGGVVAPLQLYPLYVAEINRCAALAIRRRAEIMGPACEYSPLTEQLIAGLSRRPTLPNHWSQSWIDAQLGMAYIGAGKPAQAIASLQKSLLIGGQFDHVLTPMALVELGKLAFRQGNHEVAANYYLEASYSAAAFSQHDVVEESLRLGATNHLVGGGKGIYPPLVPAAAWARRQSKQLEASLKIAAAENLAVLNQTAQATAMLADARRDLTRSAMSVGVTGARFQFVAATVAFQAGRLAEGSAALAEAMAYQRKGSFWLFHLGMVDSMYTSGLATPRVVEGLYDIVLREPDAKDWVVDPRETLGYLTTPHLPPMEHWFEVALQRDQHEKAFEIAERIRRHRFYSTLPDGGRTLALRWILEAPRGAISDNALLQRQDLLTQFPKFAQLSKQAAAVREDLRRMPLVPDENADLRRQKDLLQKLATISGNQELLLNEMALRRVPSEFAFPPMRSVKELQAALPERTRLWAFLSTSRGVYAFSLSRDDYDNGQVAEPAKLPATLAATFKQLGLFDRDGAVPADLLRDTAWQASSAKLMTNLLGSAKPDSWDDVDELVIIPDSALWYLPFELLPAPGVQPYQPMLAAVRIRYAPTASLAVPDRRASSPAGRTAMVVGALAPTDRDGSAATAAGEQIAATLARVERLPDPLNGPVAVQATSFERLIVLRDLEDGAAGVYDWRPLGPDRDKSQGTLANWMTLPWQSVEQIVLPGFHTAAESSLKSRTSGDEIFLATCGLMASGARTILLSRWRTGGQSSYELTREFVQELPFESASHAWQRSVQLLWAGGTDAAFEPRVKTSGAAGSVPAEHPFFWAGYQLIDTGWLPPTDAPEAALD